MFPLETTVLRQRTWPAFLIMALGIGIFFIPGQQKQNVPLYVGTGILVFSVVLYLLISKTRIIIDDSGISYKSIFTTKAVFWNSISKTYIKSQQHGKSRSNYWFFENPDGRKVKFSIDLLSRKSLRSIAEAITMRCKNSEIEKKIYDMAEGQFPWYII